MARLLTHQNLGFSLASEVSQTVPPRISCLYSARKDLVMWIRQRGPHGDQHDGGGDPCIDKLLNFKRVVY